jgi:hypothetical protein
MLRDVSERDIRDVMTASTEFDNPLAEAAEKIRREAYAAGWRDCLVAIAKAVSATGETAAPDSSSLTREFDRESHQHSEVTPGSTPFYVLSAVRKTPGMTSSEIVAAIQQNNVRVSDGSIRTSIFRLKTRTLIVLRHGKWFPK